MRILGKLTVFKNFFSKNDINLLYKIWFYNLWAKVIIFVVCEGGENSIHITVQLIIDRKCPHQEQFYIEAKFNIISNKFN